jgi:lipoprotein-anchoring transpeptidase ErfK/SrfK
VGSNDAVVLHVEERLVAMGYRPGAVDGAYTAETASAVMAFQKHEGLQRDGVTGPQTLGAIDAVPTGAGPRGGPGLEVDLDRQIMFVVSLDGSYQILNVSSGNNQSYRHPAGYTAVAVTPTGTFTVGRKIDGPERAPLGTLYRPMYFKGGYAVHGSTSVPAYPASHGCVRVSYQDADWLFPIIQPGTPVRIYGGGDQPEPTTDDPAA